MLEALKSLQVGLNPTNLLTDFESAAISAFQAAFPAIQASGCFFHLTQIIWRHVQQFGLARLYETDDQFARKQE